jgi:hypothetical protein
MNRENNIVFYSQHCPHSRELLKEINAKDLEKYFVFVCVEQYRNRIPPQVDRVPALLIRNEGRVLFEDEILKYIGCDVTPIETLNGFSESFSFLEEDTLGPSNNFSVFGQEQRIVTPDDDNGNQKGDGSILEKFMTDRARDVSNIFGDKR